MGGPRSPRPEQADSGVRLVPLDSDSDVRIVAPDADDIRAAIGAEPPKGATDSDIRLESLAPDEGGGKHEGPLTEEINLDEELKKDEALRRAQRAPIKPKTAHHGAPVKPAFDLSDSDFNLAPIEELEQPAKAQDSSSDFELTPASESSPIDLGSSDDFKLEVPDEDIILAEDEKAERQGPMSGVNLDHPADSGISLEDQGEASDSEFELTLEEEPVAPKSKPPSSKSSGSKLVQTDDTDSSEFELSLDVDQSSPPDSDSEFELTLDETGALSEVEEQPAAEEAEAEQDIFETDLEVPALDEESGSEVAEVEEHDTDLESPDFDLAIDEEDVAVDEESGSEVVALDEEEAIDDQAATVQTKRRGKKRALAEEEEAGEFADLDDLEEEPVFDDEGVVEVAAGEAVFAPQAPWGVLPVAVLLPCVIVMLLVGMMGFELVQTQQGYKPGVLSKALGGLTGARK
jgi:hypothetical protein